MNLKELASKVVGIRREQVVFEKETAYSFVKFKTNGPLRADNERRYAVYGDYFRAEEG